MSRARTLEGALELHTAAVDRILASADEISDAEWRAPLGEGKWSPAEVFAHLVSTYDTATGELRGGAGMKVRTRLWQRWLLRLTIVPRILEGRGFPRGAVAPRETRPGAALERGESVALFRRRAEEFDEAARQAPPGRKLTHAYFGSASIADGVVLCARHIEHHTVQLPQGEENRA